MCVVPELLKSLLDLVFFWYTIYFFIISSPLLRRILTADYSHDLHNTATRSNSETSLVSSTLGSNQLCSDLFNDDTECLIPSENNSPRHRQLRLERVIVSSDFILIGFFLAVDMYLLLLMIGIRKQKSGIYLLIKVC